MLFTKSLSRYIAPFPKFIESHDLWIAKAGNLYHSQVHYDDITFYKSIIDNSHFYLTNSIKIRKTKFINDLNYIWNLINNSKQMDDLTTFCTSLNKMINVETINENEIYNSLDILIEKDSLSNIEKKVNAKKNLVNHLTTKKEIKESKDSTLIPNENLLNAVLTNNFNALYSNTLSESQKEELKNILSIPYDEIITKTTELKESIVSQVSTLLSESNETDLINKLNAVKDEVTQMNPSRYNYYRLNELKNGLN